MNNYMLLIASIIVCCSLIALLENETVSLVEPSWVKLPLPDTATYDATYNTIIVPCDYTSTEVAE